MPELDTFHADGLDLGLVLLIIDCVVDPNALAAYGWKTGPMPFQAEVDGRHLTADGRTRSTFFTRPVAKLLYGDSDHSYATPKMHRRVMAAVGREATITEAEIMLAAEDQGWRATIGVFAEVLIHLDLSAMNAKDRVIYLHSALRTRSGRTEFLKAVDSALGDPVRVVELDEDDSASDGRIFSLFCVGVEGDPGSDGNRILELATLTPASIRTPSSDEVSQAVVDTIHPSDDWAILVRRDGAVIEGRLHAEFSTALEFYARTIYLDVFSLGRLQSRMLAELSIRLMQTILNGSIVLKQVQELEHDVAVFRAAYVWRAISSSFVGNELIRAYQTQHELHQTLADLRDNVAALSSAASLRAATLAERSSRQTNATLSVLTIFGLPLSFALVVWQTYGGGYWQLGVAVIGGLAVSAAAMLLLPGLRAIIRTLRARGE
jgi:hypothetical protein